MNFESVNQRVGGQWVGWSVDFMKPVSKQSFFLNSFSY